MGYIAHHAMIVTSYDVDLIEKAHTYAESLGLWPSEIFRSQVNLYYTFLIPPDGSKEGWPASDDGNDRRERMREFLKADSSMEWVEVRYGGDEPDRASIEHRSD